MQTRFQTAKARVEQIRPFADFALTCISVAAIIVGGWWTYRNFIAEDTHAVSPNITVSAEVQPYDDKCALLVVHVKPKNSGKVPIELDGGEKGDIDVRVAAIPMGLGTGRIDPDKLPTVATAGNIVKRFNGYIIEPGIDYDEVQTFIVRRGATYVVTAEMDHYDDDAGDEVDSSCVVRIN